MRTAIYVAYYCFSISARKYFSLAQEQMKNLTYCESWPESWKYSYPYDCLEIYGQRASLGYAYAYRQRVKHTIDFIQIVNSDFLSFALDKNAMCVIKQMIKRVS